MYTEVKEHEFFSPLAASKNEEVPRIFLKTEKDLKFHNYIYESSGCSLCINTRLA